MDNFESRLTELHDRVIEKALSDEEQASYSESLFDSIKHINDFGQEFWYARELSKVLEYKDFRNFELTIFKAMEACDKSGNEISDHFGEITEMVPIGSGFTREFSGCQLSRYISDHFADLGEMV